jgi:hypothetical protein
MMLATAHHSLADAIGALMAASREYDGSPATDEHFDKAVAETHLSLAAAEGNLAKFNSGLDGSEQIGSIPPMRDTGVSLYPLALLLLLLPPYSLCSGLSYS